MNMINLKGKKMQQDDVFPSVRIESFKDLIGFETRKGYDNLVFSDNVVVNVCSDSYALLKNEEFFLKVEEKLIEADIQYDMRSINRNNRSFAVDYILNDDRYDIVINSGKKDVIKPMLRFVNSYDGSAKTKGSFGYFRQICTNGLHVTETKLKFDVKHRGAIAEIVLPKMDMLIEQFLSNEYYTLKSKAETMSSKPISDVAKFVEKICNDTEIFKFEKNDKNAEPSKYAEQVINTIFSEANYLNVEPNMWLGYNAFNEILFDGTFSKTFEKETEFDNKIFNRVLELVN
jgi:Domain of unknown function (DUF932)